MVRKAMLGAAVLGLLAVVPLQAVEADLLLRAVNAEREAAGVAPLRCDGKLTELALEGAKRAAEQRTLSHRKDLPRVRESGGWKLLNENVYSGQGAVDEGRVLRAWMKSPGHRKNLLNPALSHAGFAAATGGDGHTYVVFNGALR